MGALIIVALNGWIGLDESAWAITACMWPGRRRARFSACGGASSGRWPACRSGSSVCRSENTHRC
ncbi:MAG: hypothetical protein CPDRYMAC_1093 [uncultured Paraburkholderia sp.]|nr:MAG: hypothetical protein CPDRYDRY_1069 [uncultured Paraburkholderia sp.]CAH2915867.1 MAG: hypothetical protein CPDRYMAC_1093 [uncultured Paraburkholderia sp.]